MVFKLSIAFMTICSVYNCSGIALNVGSISREFIMFVKHVFKHSAISMLLDKSSHHQSMLSFHSLGFYLQIAVLQLPELFIIVY